MVSMLTPPMLVSVLLLLAPCVPSLGLSPGPGSLVLVGGGLREDNTAVWEAMVQLAGGEQVARVGVITAANTDPAYQGQYWVDMFLK